MARIKRAVRVKMSQPFQEHAAGASGRRAGAVKRDLALPSLDQVAARVFDDHARSEASRRLGKIDVAQPLHQGDQVGRGKVKADPGVGLFGDRGRIAEGRLQMRNDVFVRGEGGLDDPWRDPERHCQVAPSAAAAGPGKGRFSASAKGSHTA